jgi:hypothetical protein
VRAWLAVFALTQLVEVPVVVALARRAEPRRARLVVVALLATALTHPVVWFVLPRLGLTYVAYVWLAELFAWLTEAALYARALPALGAPRAILISLAANAASAGATWAIRSATGAI